MMIEFVSVRKQFQGRTVLHDVSFGVRRGRVTALIGPNGSGKTTLVRTLLGLTHVDSGRALVSGTQYRDLDHPAKHVGVLLESSGLHPALTAHRHLEIQSRAVGAPGDRISTVLDEVGLSNASRQRIRTYSLGMRQRLGLATALLAAPEVLILDEPSNGLDPEGMRWLRRFLRSFADLGGTVLVTSHQLAELTRFIDDVVIISHGHVVTQQKAIDVSVDGLEQIYNQAVGSAGGPTSIGGKNVPE